MLIYFSDLLARYHSRQHLESFAQNAFNKVFHLIKTNLGTFGRVDEEPFDLILTNPPYVTSGSSSIKEALNSDPKLVEYMNCNEGHKPYYIANGRGTQALAIEWVIKNLKKGGEALVIVPDSLLLQENMINYIKDNCIVKGIISLPLRTFYSTAQKTYILIINKKAENKVQETCIFTYLVSEIGETRDSKRFKCEQNDLVEATNLYNLFKTGNPLPYSPRCKVIEFYAFNELDNWMIDKLWTKEEKQSLGIQEEQEIITEEEFWGIVEDIKSYLDKLEEGAI